MKEVFSQKSTKIPDLGMTYDNKLNIDVALLIVEVIHATYVAIAANV